MGFAGGRTYVYSCVVAPNTPECDISEDEVPRSEPLLPFRSDDRTMALSHRGWEADEEIESE